MQEGYQPPRRTLAWSLIEKLQAHLLVLIERCGDVVDAIRHVVQSAATLADEVGDLRIITQRSEQFDTGSVELEHHRFNAVGLDDLTM